jgi:serine protease Do
MDDHKKDVEKQKTLEYENDVINDADKDFTRGSDEIDTEPDVNFVLIEEKVPVVNHNVISEKAFQEKLHQESYLNSKPVHHDEQVIKPEKRIFTKFITAIMIIAILGGFTAGIGYRAMDYYFNNQLETSVKYIPDLTQISNEVKSVDTDISSIAKNLEPSVVAITNEIVQESSFGQQTGTSAGSGVIFDINSDKVYILTNHHVIDSSNGLSVNFIGNNQYNAVIVGSDADTDLAVVTVNITDMDQMVLNKIRPIELGDSDLIQVGETAIAIGNPLGYNNTVTVGIISALDRMISSDMNALSLIQTDAAINPGNSGGALVNGFGQLIGINTIKISDTSVEGIGFAIPVNSALPILEEIIQKGYVSKPYIGIYGRDVTPEMVEIYKLPVGVIVTRTIIGSPADVSELKVLDIIIKINNTDVTSMFELSGAIGQFEIGDTIRLTVKRDISNSNEKTAFETKVIELTIGDRYKIKAAE